MAVKTKYALKKYDLTKGQLSQRGPAGDQGLIPRTLRELRYEGDVLASRPTVEAYAGVYGAAEDITGDSLTDGDYISGATVSNICSDGRRVFGQVTLVEGSGEMSDPGFGSSSYVVEMVRARGSYVWKKTSIPAPVAARPMASFGPFSAASFGSGVTGQLLMTNWGPSAIDNIPQFHTLDVEAAVGDPLIFRKTSILSRFPDLAVTRAVGLGYSVAYDTVATAFRLIYLDGTRASTWLLRNTSTAVATESNATAWDARVINGDLYLITGGSANRVYQYKYTLPTPATGTYGSTSVNLAASVASNISTGSAPQCIAISSQSSPVEIRYAEGYNGGGSATIKSVIISATTLVATSNLSCTASSAYVRALTCNGNLIVAELSSASSEFTTWASTTYSLPLRNTSTTYFYVVSGGALTEKSAFASTGARYWGSLDNGAFTLDTNLNSHISSEGLVCVGNSIYRCIQKAAQSAGVPYVDVQFLCKAKDIDTNGSLHGDLTSTTGGRYANSLSHWVDERYVALAVGGGEIAFPVTDPGTAGAAPPDPYTVSGIESNERTVVFDVYQTQLTACEVAQGVTSLCHGWSTSTAGDEIISASFERPIIQSTSYVSRTKGIHDWTANDVVTYRAVAVCSAGGFESFVSSPPYQLTVAGADVEKDIEVTIALNARCSDVTKIRLYRNVAPMAAADYQFIGETSAPSGATGTVTIRDNRIDIQDSALISSWRPFDPTGGGVPLQGIAPAGLRDIAVVGDRVYVATSTALIPCQEAQGDDRLPTPMVDALVQIPARFGALRHIDALGDLLIASTETAILGIAGDPPNALGQGPGQIPILVSEGTGCNGKPVSTPSGLFVPRSRGITLVDRSRNAQEVYAPVAGSEAGLIRTITGACGYSVLADEAYFKGSTGEWLVLNVKGGRWTEWSDGISGDASVAAINRGSDAGAVAFNSSGVIPLTGTTFTAPVIILGWDSFPDRFTESKVSRYMLDGYASDGTSTVAASLQMSYDLDTYSGGGTVINYTIPARTESNHSQGFRAQFAPARIAGSSFMARVTLTPSVAFVKLNIETIAIDVLESTKQNVAGTEPV